MSAGASGAAVPQPADAGHLLPEGPAASGFAALQKSSS